MALLTYTDLEQLLNVDLTDPNGQALVTTLIAAAVKWAEHACSYPFEQASQTEYLDGGESRYFLSTGAPVDTASVTASVHNSATDAYDAFTGTLRASSDAKCS